MIRLTRIHCAFYLILFFALSTSYVRAQESEGTSVEAEGSSGAKVSLSQERINGRQQECPRDAGMCYTVSLAKARENLVSVSIELPPGAAERDLQLPVWYALYQVRDFSQYISWVRATGGASVAIQKVNKSEWRITGAERGAEIEYEMFADDPGPFGAQLNSHHAFFNLAEILMYPVDARNSPLEIRFSDVPPDWKIGAALRKSAWGFAANNYDELADSPVEIGSFEERDLDDHGGHYRVIVDAISGDYDMNALVTVVHRIVSAEVRWMADRPFATYLFIYHFPRESGGGGMEHSYSTAIDVNAHTLSTDPSSVEGVTAHEFFHLWNVKRIRPQSLQYSDYTKENYTNALWFSEGFTTTVEDYTLLRAGMLDEQEYLSHLASAITELESRPAHLTQSAEESSIDAWLEKYSYYRGPERSISYYNKGELLGVLLDLKLRDLSGGTKSLRDLFQWMNSNYAEKGKYFLDSAGVLRAADAISHSDMNSFFKKYVAGTDEIPWNDFFFTVGLQAVSENVESADPGFSAARNFDSPLTVTSVAENGAAENAGLLKGDTVLTINAQDARNFEHILESSRPGETIQLRIRRENDKSERELSWKLGMREKREFHIQNVANPTPLQKAGRAAWLRGESLRGESQPAGAHP
ncbi:MAG: M61 family metallopeptidase [Terriglobales bacterium]